MEIYSSLSSRKCAFEYYFKVARSMEQMYLARPTEDLGIDSILVFLSTPLAHGSQKSQIRHVLLASYKIKFKKCSNLAYDSLLNSFSPINKRKKRGWTHIKYGCNFSTEIVSLF